jgi:hypothetical protein
MKKLTLVLTLVLLLGSLAAAQKPEPKLSKQELALDNLQASKRGLAAATAAWHHAVDLYGNETREAYLAHINVAEARADLCEAENDAGVRRCKTTRTETDDYRHLLITVMYFNGDGTVRATHFYFAEHEDGTYEQTETTNSASR